MANADAVEIGGIWYNLVSKAKLAEVTQNPNGGYKGDVVIPKTVEYKKITYDVTSIGKNAFSYCNNMTSITIPNSVTSIGEEAFYSCSTTDEIGLTSIELPNSVTIIDSYAFGYCSGLKSITIPNGVTSIGVCAFRFCSSLTSIEIPNSVTSIEHAAFEGCVNLVSVVISNSVTSLVHTFEGCTNLTSVTIPNSVTSLDATFEGCTNLSSITIPNNVTSVSNDTFKGCSSLTSIVIPNSVNNIGNEAFQYCSSLTSITIGSGVTSIASLSFANCSELADVYCYAKELPWTSDDAFQNSYVKYTTLYVVKELLDDYKATEPWKNFKEILPIGGSSGGGDYEYVDLGLPSGTKWASKNVGANNPEDAGDIFAWGETTAKTTFTENNYLYGTSLTDMTKYNSSDGLTTLETSDDAATVNWGSDWRMPTVVEWRELRDKCTREWTTVNGITGYTFTGPNGNQIFLPCGFDNFWGNGAGYYWSSSLSETYETAAWNVDYDKGGFYIDHKEPTGFDHRYTGRNIRPVHNDASPAPITQKCATPTISYSSGKLRFTCETPDVEFFYDISSTDNRNGKGSEVDVTPIYTINVYASKDGYLDSDIATADINMTCDDASSYVRGDLTGDGKVDVIDHVELTKIIMKQE